MNEGEPGLDVLDGGDDGAGPVRKRNPLRWALLALAGAVVLLLVVVGFYAVRGIQALNEVRRDPDLMPDYQGRPTAAQPEAPSPPVNFVLIGSDTRGGERGRSDVLMIAHLNSERDQLYLVSFPRDLYVPIPGHGKNKINAAYSLGGPALTVRTLENLLDVPMDHTALIDFEGFIGLSDAVGGVTIFNEVDSASAGYDFPRGELTLSGNKLLAYVRERYDLPRGDLDRAARQRTVVKALVLKLARPSTLANPVAFNEVAARIGRYFTVDDRLDNAAVWSLATSLQLRGGDGIRQIEAPISGFGRSPQGASIDIVDGKRMAELARLLRADELGTYWDRYGQD